MHPHLPVDPAALYAHDDPVVGGEPGHVVLRGTVAAGLVAWQLTDVRHQGPLELYQTLSNQSISIYIYISIYLSI